MSGLAGLLSRYRGQSDPQRSERRVELVCLLLGLLLVVQLAWLGFKLLNPPDPEDILPSPDSLGVGELLARGSVDAGGSAELRARPLFWEGRRPVQVVVKAPAPKQQKARSLSGLQLLGVFGGGDTRGIIALQDGKRLRVLQGGEVAGWTVEEVGADQVTLTSGTRREVISLKRDYSGISYKEAAGKGKQAVDPGAEAARGRPQSGGLVLGGRGPARD